MAVSLTSWGIATILALISALDIFQGTIGRDDHDTTVMQKMSKNEKNT